MRIDCYGLDGMRRAMAQTWYFALSLAYLKRLGARVVLHTDTLGEALIGWLPYDDVRLTLDAMPEDIHPRFWAAGKFAAIEAEKGRCVHIDGDVFIKRRELLELIDRWLNRHVLLVQSTDPAKMYGLEVPLFSRDELFCRAHYCFPDGRDSYNTGVLGFGSEEVKDAVTGNYFAIVKEISSKYWDELDRDRMLTPDLIAEQKMIEMMSRMRGWSTRVMLGDRSEAVSLGYQHVFTVDKFNVLDLCKTTLEKVDHGLYCRVKRMWG